MPAYGNLHTHGECACPAHAADECILRREGRHDKSTMLPLAKLLWTRVIQITDNCYHISNELLRARITATVMRVGLQDRPMLLSFRVLLCFVYN